MKDLYIKIRDLWDKYNMRLYAFIKMGVGIKNLIKPRIKTDVTNLLSHLSLISALFAMFLVEFALIATFSEGEIDHQMYIMELTSQFFIFAFTLVTAVVLFIKFIRRNKKEVA